MKRDATLDALRGLAITLVVLGHSIGRAMPSAPSNSYIYQLISAVDMPLFMVVSGYLATRWNAAAPIAAIRKCALSLLVPYLAWVVLDYPLQGTGSFFSYLARAVIYPTAPGGKWFLYVLFLCTALFIVLRRFYSSDIALIVSAVIIGLLGAGATGQMAAFGLINFHWLYPFFVFGFLATRVPDPEVPIWTLALLFLVFAIGAPMVYANQLRPDWYVDLHAAADAAGVPGSGLALLAARYLVAGCGVCVAYLTWRRWGPAGTAVLVWLGTLTLGIYVLHDKFLWLSFGAGWVRVAIATATALAVSAAITFVLQPVPVIGPVLFGRPARRAPSAVATQPPTA